MGDLELSIKAKLALRYIRNFLMHHGQLPSVRNVMNALDYKSPRSAVLLMEELAVCGFLEKKEDGSYRMLKDLESDMHARTVDVPLVGAAACGFPILAEENVQALIPVSIEMAKPGGRYFLLRAVGNSMDMAGIEDGDLVLVKQQPIANNGDKVVALIDDEATIKEFRCKGNVIMLIPNSSNSEHQPIILTRNFLIQGVVVDTIPKF